MFFLLVLHIIYPSLLTHFHQRLAHKDIGHVWHRPQFFHHLPSPRFRHLWISRVETSQVDQSGNFKVIHPPQLLEAATFLTCLGWIPWYFNIFHLNPNRRKTILTQPSPPKSRWKLPGRHLQTWAPLHTAGSSGNWATALSRLGQCLEMNNC